MKKPKIRFKGYQEDWEQRKLVDLVDRVTRKNQDLVSELPLTISAQYGLIDQNEFFDKRVASKDVSGYYLIENGEFAYNKSTSTDAPWGAIKRLDRYKNGVLSTLYIVFGIKENNPVDSDFLVSYYSTNLWHKGIHEIAAEGARNHGLLNIAPADFFETKLMIPQDIEEQKKIGKYFEELERLITLHQRKCEETKTLKKYMLQKMFPQNGHSVPEIRFSGFTEDWEQRKFSELYARSSEKNDGSIGMDKNITVATMQFRNDVRVSTTEYLKTYYTFKLGDIAFEGHQSKEFRYGRFVENDIGNGIVSHIFAVFRPIQEYDLYFWKYAINNETLMQRILARSTKASTMMHDLVTNDFLNETFLVPSVTEQKQIGTLLNNLDHLITLHHRKYMKYADLSVFDWEQRKFADFTWDAGKRNKEDLDLEPYAITNEHGFIRQRDAHDDFGYMKDTDRKAYNIVQPNSFAYNPARINVGSIGYYKGVENVIVSSLYEVFQTDNYVNDRFLWHWLKSDEFPRWIEKLQEGSVRLYFYYDKLCECQLYMPSLEEQEKIATFLDDLDHLITLHHRKQNYVLNTLIYAKTTLFITKTS